MRVPRQCFFVIIFEGRTGSTHLISALNSHPDVIAYPEILNSGSSGDLADINNQVVIDVVMDCLLKGGAFESVYPYAANPDYHPIPLIQKQDPLVVGFKTRVHNPEDAIWYDRFQLILNKYYFDKDYLLSLLEEHQFFMVRLRRDNLLKGAISWLRVSQLVKRRRKWNISTTDQPDEALYIEIEDLLFTLNWLEKNQQNHDRYYDRFSGKKMIARYEDMLADEQAFFEEILRFLELPIRPLSSQIKKNTSDDLRLSVANYDEIVEAVSQTRFSTFL